jgi:cytochrome c551/c552
MISKLLSGIAAIAVIAYVGDNIVKDYNLNPGEANCISSSVEDTVLNLILEKQIKDMREDGVILRAKINKEATFTTNKEPSYFRGRHKYSCSTEIQLTLTADGKKENVKELLSVLPGERIEVTLKRDYRVAANDLGTSFYVQSEIVTEDQLKEVFNEEFEMAGELLRERKEKEATDKKERKESRTDEEKKVEMVERGKELFETSMCTGCHSIDTDETLIGPSLKGITAQYSDVYIRDSILNPGSNIDPKYKEGVMPTMMPTFSFREDEMKDLIEFLKTK